MTDFSDHPDFDGAGTYYHCPLNPDHLIKAIDPHDPAQAALDIQVGPKPGEDPMHALIRAQIEKRVAADEAAILAHVELQHTLHEVLVALGTARNALLRIRDQVTSVTLHAQHHNWAARLGEIANRGLGGE